jgi:hypothetical protein
MFINYSPLAALLLLVELFGRPALAISRMRFAWKLRDVSASA